MRNSSVKWFSKKMMGIALLVSVARVAQATNGDNLEGVGTVSEALGGTGVAAPQDGLTAIVNNPAGLSFAPGAKGKELTVGLTLFHPTVDARISTPAGTLTGGSDDPVSLIPFLAYSQPLNERWNFGFGAYGVSGMGVDYRGQGWDLDGNPANGFEGDLFSKYSSLKVAPALSYDVATNLALGVALHGNYSTLDLGQDNTDAFGVGASLGVTYRVGAVQLGASYTTPQKSTFDGVFNFDSFTGDMKSDNLSLEQPAVYAAGAAWQPSDQWLLEFNLKYLPWSDTDGYGDFDWDDQWVYAVGLQYNATEKLALRAGFNYAENPVREHHGFDPSGVTVVQGKQVPTFGYELLRNVGFPAIVESHLTLGFGYRLTDTLTLNVAYAHVFENEISSTSAGDAIALESTLSEDSLGLSLAWALN